MEMRSLFECTKNGITSNQHYLTDSTDEACIWALIFIIGWIVHNFRCGKTTKSREYIYTHIIWTNNWCDQKCIIKIKSHKNNITAKWCARRFPLVYYACDSAYLNRWTERFYILWSLTCDFRSPAYIHNHGPTYRAKIVHTPQWGSSSGRSIAPIVTFVSFSLTRSRSHSLVRRYTLWINSVFMIRSFVPFCFESLHDHMQFNA